MNIDNDLQTLKESYRKIFIDIGQDIDLRLKNGESLEQLEKLYKQECLDMLNEINEARKSCACTGCGTCCRFAVSEFSPENLRKKAKCGDVYASQFIKTFIPYKSIEDAREIYPEYVEFLEQNSDGEFYIYHCPKVTEDNRCPDYENRPQICRDFPEISNVFLPKMCTFTPWKLQSLPVWLKLNAKMEILDFYKQNLKDL